MLCGHASGRDFPVPPNSQVGIVSEQAGAQGLRMKIQRFSSTKQLSEVVEFYKQLWSERAAVTQFSPWTMVGNKIADKFYNVQLQSNSQGTWGYLSISDLAERLEKGEFPRVLNHVDFPAMGGSKVVDKQTHSDKISDSKTLMLLNNFSVAANSKYYINHYRQRGWQLKQDTVGSAVRNRVLVLAKGGQNISLTIGRNNRHTMIVATVIEGRLIGE
jgi:hypothetical protein